jgi:hypothetical protein
MYRILVSIFPQRSIFGCVHALQLVSRKRPRGIKRDDTGSHSCFEYDVTIENDGQELGKVDCMKSQYHAAEGTIAEGETVISPVAVVDVAELSKCRCPTSLSLHGVFGTQG